MKRRSIILSVGLFALLASVPILSAQKEKSTPPESTSLWMKGNLHTHSLWSDGDDYPEMIVDWYVTHGYQFLALSDHNTLGQGEKWFKVDDANKRAKTDTFTLYEKRFGDWVETRAKGESKEVRLKPLSEFRTLFEKPGQFLLIQGEEITDKLGPKPIHMNASNLLEYIKPQGGSTVTEVMSNNLAAVEEQKIRLGRPILTHLNHPNFGYGITAEELAMVTRERFFEVYNGHPAVNHRGDITHVGVERMWDIINTLRISEMKSAPVFGLATDDSHNYFNKPASSPGRGWVMVRANYLTPDSIIKGLESGDFYASSGVALSKLEYVETDRTLEIEAAPETGSEFTIEFIGTLKNFDPTRKTIDDENGKPLDVTKRYSDDVGKVLASAKGRSAKYKLTGEELYVRAVVTSSLAPENPVYEGQKAQAWTQPIGWKKWMGETPRLTVPVEPKKR